MRRSGILMFALFFCGCGGLFYSEMIFGGTGSTAPCATISPPTALCQGQLRALLPGLRADMSGRSTILWTDLTLYTVLLKVLNHNCQLLSVGAIISNDGAWLHPIDVWINVADGTATQPYSITNATHCTMCGTI
jgi:hypothetical protein